jgi:uncharacterized protein YggE
MKLAFLILVLGISPALAQTASPPAQSRTLTMSGAGEARAVPDMVTFTAGVSSQAPTAAAALAANSTHMKSVMAALKKIGIADKDMQTINFSISPRFADEDNQARHVTGYRVNNDLRIQLDDVKNLGGALDALVGAGANQVNAITFAIRDPAPLLARARQGAVADARARAMSYAAAAGVSLGPILSISENGGNRPAYAPMPMLRAAQSVPIAAGEESVTAAVSIVWEIH